MIIFEEADTFWSPRLTQFDPIITTSVADPADRCVFDSFLVFWHLWKNTSRFVYFYLEKYLHFKTDIIWSMDNWVLVRLVRRPFYCWNIRYGSFTTAFVWHFDLRFWIAYLILFQFQFALNFSYKKLFPKIAPLLRDRFHCLQTLYFGGRVDMSSVPLVQEYYLFCYLILYNTQVNFCFQNSCWKYISSFWLKTQIELAKVAWFS